MFIQLKQKLEIESGKWLHSNTCCIYNYVFASWIVCKCLSNDIILNILWKFANTFLELEFFVNDI